MNYLTTCHPCIRLFGATIAIGLATVNAFAVPPGYEYDIVQAPFNGASETELFGINNSGIAVGSYLNQAGERRGIIYDSTTDAYTDYSVPGSDVTRLFGINDAGQIVGYWRNDTVNPDVQNGFRRDVNGDVSPVNYPGQDTNYAFRINSSGQVAGYYFDFSNGFFINSFRRESDGSFTDALFSTTGSGTVTRGINDAGTLVGWSLEPDDSTPGVIFDGSAFTTFSLGADKSTLPNDINNLGDIVGNVAALDFTGSRGFVRDSLGNVAFLNVADAEFTEALGMNDAGIVVGYFEDENENVLSFIATPVPEPSSMVLGLIAAAGLWWLRPQRQPE